MQVYCCSMGSNLLAPLDQNLHTKEEAALIQEKTQQIMTELS